MISLILTMEIDLPEVTSKSPSPTPSGKGKRPELEMQEDDFILVHYKDENGRWIGGIR